MKTFSHITSHRRPARPKATYALTLTETMTTAAIFSLVVIAMVSLQIFGFKMNSLTSSKLKAAAYSLKVLDQVRNQIREASLVEVGNDDSTSFTPTGTNGNALKIYSPTNSFILFYLDIPTTTFYRLNGSNSQPVALASNVINQTVFQIEDWKGNLSVNNNNHKTIKMTLQFQQLDFTVPTNVYDYYTLETRMTPRLQN